MQKKNIPNDVKDNIVEDFNSGYSYMELERKYGFSAYVIKRALTELGFKSRSHKETLMIKNGIKDWDELIDRWMQGESMQSIAESFGISVTFLRNTMISKGVQIDEILNQRKYGDLSEKDVEDMISLYKQGKDIKVLSEMYNVNSFNTTNILKENGVTLRTRSEIKRKVDEEFGSHRIHSLNEQYFDEWSSEMAYWLGFIYADGSVQNNDRAHRLKIGLTESDVDHLEKFKKALEYTGNVKISKTNYTKVSGELAMSSVIDINSKKLITTLVNIGVIPNKSLTVEFPDVPEEYELDFIRGYFDGDGSVGIQYPTNTKGVRTVTPQIRVRLISGSLAFIEKLEDILHRRGLKRKKISKNKRTKNYLYEICYSTKESMILYDMFYKEESVRLDRKYKSFTEYINLRKQKLEENKK